MIEKKMNCERSEQEFLKSIQIIEIFNKIY